MRSAKIAQRLGPAFAGLQLQIHDGQLLGDLRMRLLEFLGHLQNGLVEPQPDSTQTTSRSRALANPRWICF